MTDTIRVRIERHETEVEYYEVAPVFDHDTGEDVIEVPRTAYERWQQSARDSHQAQEELQGLHAARHGRIDAARRVAQLRADLATAESNLARYPEE